MFEPSRGKYKYTIHFSVNRYSLTAIPFVNLVFFGLFSTIYTVQPKLQKKTRIPAEQLVVCMEPTVLNVRCLKCHYFSWIVNVNFLLPLNIIESLMMYHAFL